jgi:hypothetical protein
MAKLKDKTHAEKRLGIIEFGLLVTGIFHFDDFHKYTLDDLKYCLNELHLSLYEKAIFTNYVPNNNRNNSGNYVSEFQLNLRVFNQQKITKNYLTAGIFIRLEKLPQEQKKNIKNFIALIENQARTSPSNFPLSIRHHSSQTDSRNAVFALNELCKWTNESMDLEDITIADWFKEYQKNHKAIENNAEYGTKDGYIKIDTLPKIMQFMIECFNEPTFQHSFISNKELPTKTFKPQITEQLNPLAVKRGFTYTKQNTQYKGIAPTKLEYIVDLIQKDENN